MRATGTNPQESTVRRCAERSFDGCLPGRPHWRAPTRSIPARAAAYDTFTFFASPADGSISISAVASFTAAG